MDAEAARRLAEDGHAARIAAKLPDVVLDPAQRRLLIHESVVARRMIGRLGGQRGMGEEAQSAQPVVHGDDDDAFVHEPRRIVVVALAHEERAAVEPHHHRERLVELVLRPVAVGGSEDVEEEAVLGRAGEAERRGDLRTVICELRRVADALPARVGARRLPAQIAGRCGRIGNPEELVDAARAQAADRPLAGLDDRPWRVGACCRTVQGGGSEHENENRRFSVAHGCFPPAPVSHCETELRK